MRTKNFTFKYTDKSRHPSWHCEIRPVDHPEKRKCPGCGVKQTQHHAFGWRGADGSAKHRKGCRWIEIVENVLELPPVLAAALLADYRLTKPRKGKTKR